MGRGIAKEDAINSAIVRDWLELQAPDRTPPNSSQHDVVEAARRHYQGLNLTAAAFLSLCDMLTFGKGGGSATVPEYDVGVGSISSSVK